MESFTDMMKREDEDGREKVRDGGRCIKLR